MKVTLLERSPGVWRVRIERNLNGERVFSTETVRGDRIAAEVRRAELLGKAAEYIAPDKITVERFITQRLARQLASKDISQVTHDDRMKTLRLYVAPTLGNVQMRKVTGHDVQALYTALAGRLGKGTLAQVHSGLMAPAFKAARKMKVIPTNPLDDIEKAPARPKPKPKAFTMVDARRIIEAAKSTKWALPVQLLFAAGIRRGELVKITVNDVHDGGVDVSSKTEAGVRFIPLPSDVFVQIQALCTGEGRLFDFTATALGTAVSRIGKKIGLHMHAHKARHTHATHLLRTVGKEGAKAVSQRLGHADVAVTLSVYQTVLEEDARNLADLAGTFTRV